MIERQVNKQGKFRGYRYRVIEMDEFENFRMKYGYVRLKDDLSNDEIDGLNFDLDLYRSNLQMKDESWIYFRLDEDDSTIKEKCRKLIKALQDKDN